MRELLCYTYGHGSQWQAICVDLDISVTAHTQEDVDALLRQAISTYIQDAHQEEPRVRDRLLRRRAPFATRAKLWLALQAYLLLRRRDHKNSVAVSGVACPA